MKEKKVVFIVGAGAVEGAWNPIYSSFKNVLNSSIKDADGANFQFARLIYLMRFYSASKFAETTKNSLEKTKQLVVELKHEIAKQLNQAQQNKEIKARKHFEALLANFIFIDNIKFAVISTNWDTVINDAVNSYADKIDWGNKINIFHLHGSIENPNNLYLPSEITCENYRTIEEDNEHGKNLAFLLTILKKANKVILYGISLDPLDAELNHTIFVGLNNNELEEIIIINPDYNKVANRIKILLEEFKKNIKISCFNPNEYDI